MPKTKKPGGCIMESFQFRSKFPTLKEIELYLRKIVMRNKGTAEIEIIGKSYYKKNIEMIRIASDLTVRKPAVLIDAGIHAREWITQVSALFIIHCLTHPYYRCLLGRFDYYIIPCLNPDGYEYSHDKYRLWRKNLNPNDTCEIETTGVDLNRNFSYGYGLSSGSSCSKRSQLYRGARPLSEPECQSLDHAMRKYRNYIKLYISLHTYGNCIMYPWGFRKRRLPDEDLLRTCGEVAGRVMGRLNGRKYKIGSISKLMYLASGNAADHAKGRHKIKFVYTIELQKSGSSGFESGITDIPAIAQEVMAGVEAMAGYVYDYINGDVSIYSTADSGPPRKRRRL